VNYFVIVTTLVLIGIGYWQVQIMKKSQSSVATESPTAPSPSPYKKYWPMAVMVLIMIGNWIPYYLIKYQTTPTWQHVPEDQLEKIENKEFINQTIDIDGKLFRNCKFVNARLVIHGKKNSSMVANHFDGPLVLTTDNPSALSGAAFVVDFLTDSQMIDGQVIGFDSTGNDIIICAGCSRRKPPVPSQ
jgi:hypothetical protein